MVLACSLPLSSLASSRSPALPPPLCYHLSTPSIVPPSSSPTTPHFRAFFSRLSCISFESGAKRTSAALRRERGRTVPIEGKAVRY